MLPARRKKGGQILRFRDRGGAENRRNSRTDYPFDRGEIPFYSICEQRNIEGSFLPFRQVPHSRCSMPKRKKVRFGMLVFCNAPFSLSGCGVFVFSNEAAEIFSFCRQKK